MDKSIVLDSGFLERMNTLLANGEVRREGGDGGGKRMKVQNDCGYYRGNWDIFGAPNLRFWSITIHICGDELMIGRERRMEVK